MVGCNVGKAEVRFDVSDQNAPAQPVRWSFDADSPGRLPMGATEFAGSWSVRAESDAPSPPHALCQTGFAEYPALSLGETVYRDLAMSVRFKPISGRVDQAAGLIFRVQDGANYYILRANALENNVNFYIYTGGRRAVLKEGAQEVRSGAWQELRLEVRGSTFRGFLDGQEVVEASDETFPAGGVGLWTKADAVTCFDDVEVRAL